MKPYLLMMLAALLPLKAAAQESVASPVEKAVRKLQLDSVELRADSLPQVKTISRSGKDITLRFSGKGDVEHIGIPLFSQEMRLLQPSPVYDFLEYATLDKLFKIEDNTLRLDEVKFSKGGWNLLPGILEKSDYSTISNLNDKSYQVEWLKGGQQVVALTFPINYELLANSEREEMEIRFVKGLKNYRDTQVGEPQIVTERLQSTEVPDLLVMKGQSYLIPAINNDRYVSVVSEEDTTAHDTVVQSVLKYRLLFDRHNAAESFANLMVEPLMEVGKDSINLQIRYYNYKRETVKVAVRDFLSFCIKEGCTPYFDD